MQHSSIRCCLGRTCERKLFACVRVCVCVWVCVCVCVCMCVRRGCFVMLAAPATGGGTDKVGPLLQRQSTLSGDLVLGPAFTGPLDTSHTWLNATPLTPHEGSRDLFVRGVVVCVCVCVCVCV